MAKTLVVIPTYNAERFISRSIDSCLNQTIIPEVYVVDNCSSDSTQRIVEEYCRNNKNVKLYVNTENLGRIGNWNRCLDIFEETGYDYVKILFMGDELLNNCIERIEAIANEQNELMSIVWPYFIRGSDGVDRSTPPKESDNRLYNKESLVEDGLFPGNFLGAIVAVVLSKEAVKNNRFDGFFVGIIPFYDRVVVRGNSYYINEPLSRFNVDSHRTFNRSLSYDIVLELAFCRAHALEENRQWISAEKYLKIKENIIIDLVVDQIKYMRTVFLAKFIVLLSAHIVFKKSFWSIRRVLPVPARKLIRSLIPSPVRLWLLKRI